MKIGLFTDSHFSSHDMTCGTRYNNKSLNKIKEAIHYFEESGCERVICLGDLIDYEDDHETVIHNLKSIAELFLASTLKYTVLMGNHDCFCLSQDEFYGVLGETTKPVTLVEGNKTLFFIDACYYFNGEHYAPEKSHDWMDTNCSDLSILNRRLNTTQGTVLVFMHQNIDPDIPESCRLNNDQAVRQLLEESGKVKTVFQGHYHPGNENMVNGIKYITIPAMCEHEKAFFIYQL